MTTPTSGLRTWTILPPLLLTLLAVSLSVPATAQSGAGTAAEVGPESDTVIADEPGGFVGELLALDNLYGGKLVDLARAIPGERFSWRPAEGVRSISQAFMHAATTNFNVARDMGIPAPANLPADLETVTDKARVVELLSLSFDQVRQGLRVLAGIDLEQGARVDDHQTTIRGALLNYAEHHGEHLGQLIAYARSVGVTPPWSQ